MFREALLCQHETLSAELMSVSYYAASFFQGQIRVYWSTRHGLWFATQRFDSGVLDEGWVEEDRKFSVPCPRGQDQDSLSNRQPKSTLTRLDDPSQTG